MLPPDYLQALLNIVDPITGEQRITTKNLNLGSTKVTKDFDLFKRNLLLRNEATNEYRFSVQDCFKLDAISHKIEKFPELFNELLSVKDDNVPAYDTYDLIYLMKKPSYFQNAPELGKRLLHLKHNGKARFTPSEITMLLYQHKNIETYPEYFEELLAETYNNGNPKNDGYDCCMKLKKFRVLQQNSPNGIA